jgi:3-hydroxyacyl-CoA dehydrogenase, C-terminal domain
MAHDAIRKLGMGHPMGPLELADFLGIDVCVNILDGCTLVSATRNTGRVRCCGRWPRQAGWDARAGGGFTITGDRAGIVL